MSTPGGRPENIKKPTPEEARENGRKGGIKSGEVRKERKLLSQIYAEILAETYGVDGDSPLKNVVKAILGREDGASVSMIKEIREATEGNKLDIGGEGIRIIYQVADDGQADSSK